MDKILNNYAACGGRVRNFPSHRRKLQYKKTNCCALLLSCYILLVSCGGECARELQVEHVGASPQQCLSWRVVVAVKILDI